MKYNFVNISSYVTSKELHLSTKILDTSWLAIIAMIMSGKNLLGANPIISFSLSLING